jgi:hypothetical protein
MLLPIHKQTFIIWPLSLLVAQRGKRGVKMCMKRRRGREEDHTDEGIEWAHRGRGQIYINNVWRWR